MPTGPRQGTGYEPGLSGTGPQGVQPLLEFRTHSLTLSLALERGVYPWIPGIQPEPRGSCLIAFGKSDTPWERPTGCLRLFSFGTTIMCVPGAERRPFASGGGYRNGLCLCAGTADRLHRVTPTGNQIADETRANESRQQLGENKNRRSRFRFLMVGLKPGDEVVFKDDASKRAVVVDDLYVEFNGVTTSLSRFAAELLGAPDRSVQGTIYFTYDDELLDDMRRRFETVEKGDE